MLSKCLMSNLYRKSSEGGIEIDVFMFVSLRDCRFFFSLSPFVNDEEKKRIAKVMKVLLFTI